METGDHLGYLPNPDLSIHPTAAAIPSSRLSRVGRGLRKRESRGGKSGHEERDAFSTNNSSVKGLPLIL